MSKGIGARWRTGAIAARLSKTAGRRDGIVRGFDMAAGHPMHDTKISIAVRDDLETWQKLNVVAFLASGVAAHAPDAIGEPYVDADGTRYLAMLGQPVMVLAGDGAALAKAHRRALDRNLPVAVYSEGMFATGNDDDNRAVVAALSGDDLQLVGLATRGARPDVDKALKGLKLHR